MNRRSFIASTALGAAASVVSGSHARGLTRQVEAKPSFPDADNQDRGTNRDAAELQSSAVVVDGLDVSSLNENYVQMLKKGGVSCWHKSIDGLDGFAALYRFLDGHGDVVAATSVRDIREAHRDNRIALVSGWQSAEELGQAQNSPIG